MSGRNMSFSFSALLDAYLGERHTTDTKIPDAHRHPKVSRSMVLEETVRRYERILSDNLTTAGVLPNWWRFITQVLVDRDTGLEGGVVQHLPEVLQEWLRKHEKNEEHFGWDVVTAARRWSLVRRIAVVDQAERMIRHGSTKMRP